MSCTFFKRPKSNVTKLITFVQYSGRDLTSGRTQCQCFTVDVLAEVVLL